MGQNESIYDASKECTYGFKYDKLQKKGFFRKEKGKDRCAGSPLIDPEDRDAARREREAVEKERREREAAERERRRREEEEDRRRKLEQEREKAASRCWKSSPSDVPYNKF